MTEKSQLQGIIIGVSLSGDLHLKSRPGLTKLPLGSSAQHPIPNNKRQGTQPHLIADRLLKVIQSSQTPQNLPPDAALLIRESRLSSIHQSIGTSPSHQETYIRPWTNLTYQGADTKRKRNYDPATCRKEVTNTVR